MRSTLSDHFLEFLLNLGAKKVVFIVIKTPDVATEKNCN